MIQETEGKSGTESDGSRENEKNEKKKIESLAAFIEEFYRGRCKSLNGSLVNRIKKKPVLTDEQADFLKRFANENDAKRDKTLNLWMQANEITSYPAVKAELVNFIRKQLLPLAEGPEGTREKSWFARFHDNEQISELIGEYLDEKGGLKDRPAKDRKVLEVRLDNELLLALAIMNSDGLPEDVILRRLGKACSGESRDLSFFDLLRLLQKVSVGKAAGVGWVVDQSLRRIESAERSVDIIRENNERLSLQIEGKDELLSGFRREIEMLKEKIAAKDRELTEKDEQIRVSGIHLNDDLNRFQSRVVNLMDSELGVLRDALTALHRDPPKTGVASTYLDDAISKIEKELKKIREE